MLSIKFFKHARFYRNNTNQDAFHPVNHSIMTKNDKPRTQPEKLLAALFG